MCVGTFAGNLCGRFGSIAAFLFVWSLGYPPAAAAQAKITNREFVRNLFFLGPLDSQETLPGTSERIDESASNSADEIAKFVGFGISSGPLGSSSAGFSYARDSVTGELSLKTRSFGPLLAERPLTNGKGVVNFGFNYHRAVTKYNQDFDTQDARETGIPIFDNRVVFLADGKVQFVTRRAFLESTVDNVNLFASVGATERIDFGVTVPILSVKLTGHTDESYDISRTFGAPTIRGAFERNYRGVPIGLLNIPAPANPGPSQSATGVGDVILRSKIALTSQQRGEGAAVAVDINLPTGDEEQFLGRGTAAARFLLIGSKALGARASVYGNGGYRFGVDSNEAQYVAGVDVSLLTPDYLTVGISFLGRAVRNAASLTRVQTVARVSANLGNTEPDVPNPEESSVEVYRFFWGKDTANLNRLAAEFKLQLKGQWLATGAVVFPLSERGLQPRPVPFFGLEWAGGQ
jgi:hypothetical protein